MQELCAVRDAGEAVAIVLAVEPRAEFLLVDERRGRRYGGRAGAADRRTAGCVSRKRNGLAWLCRGARGIGRGVTELARSLPRSFERINSFALTIPRKRYAVEAGYRAMIAYRQVVPEKCIEDKNASRSFNRTTSGSPPELAWMAYHSC
ncbi:hypothetical protein SBA4_1100008 [Candidatus Sulfopaludibacter sp. SbA4]|nr:hypothetical protein SBA4_1100008 [Candidatus Sulfopaludibacter sp. SbA4]